MTYFSNYHFTQEPHSRAKISLDTLLSKEIDGIQVQITDYCLKKTWKMHNSNDYNLKQQEKNSVDCIDTIVQNDCLQLQQTEQLSHSINAGFQKLRMNKYKKISVKTYRMFERNKIQPKVPSKGSINMFGKRVRKRVHWTSLQFNHLRSQSILKFERSRMSQLLKRDKQNIFSKIQKHKEVLSLIKSQIQHSLKSFVTQKQYQQDTQIPSQLINIDNYQKSIYFEISKYFREIKEFWDFQNQTFGGGVGLRIYKASKLGLDILQDYVPNFIKDTNLTHESLQAQVCEGLTYEQATQTTECINKELEAHSRSKTSKGRQKKICGKSYRKIKKIFSQANKDLEILDLSPQGPNSSSQIQDNLYIENHLSHRHSKRIMKEKQKLKSLDLKKCYSIKTLQFLPINKFKSVHNKEDNYNILSDSTSKSMSKSDIDCSSFSYETAYDSEYPSTHRYQKSPARLGEIFEVDDDFDNYIQNIFGNQYKLSPSMMISSFDINSFQENINLENSIKLLKSENNLLNDLMGIGQDFSSELSNPFRKINFSKDQNIAENIIEIDEMILLSPKKSCIANSSFT